MEEYSDRTPSDIARYPMVPIRDVVIFPFTKVAFKIGRPGSVRALELALASDRTIFLATQHDATVDEPAPEQIYGIGTIARILQSQRQENGQIKVVVEGRERATTVRVENNDGAFTALVRRAPVVKEEGSRTDALVQKIAQLIEQHLRLAPEVQPDALQTAMRNADPSHMADALASQLRISVEDKQGLLELFSSQARLARLIEILEIELEKRQLDRTIQTRVKRQMEKAQKFFFQAEDGIRDLTVTGVQTCALPICTRCTGTLIAPAVVLTAAHCLYNRPTRALLQPVSLHVLLGYQRSAYRWHRLVARVRVGSGFDGAKAQPQRADWARLELAEPIPAAVSPLTIETEAPAPGTPLALAGYNQDRSQLLVADTDCHVIAAVRSDRKSTRLNSSHSQISYAVFCLKK